MITGFGIYLIILNVIAICANFWYAGNGGVRYGPGTCIIGALWAILNVLGIIFIGTGVGI